MNTQTLLDSLTVPGTLYQRLPNQAVRCTACGHECLIRDGRRGICKVRFNRGGELYVPWGYVAALQADPVEKKPFYHVLPGSIALTFGMLGCDFHCGYCQNWVTSQTLRDPAADRGAQWIRQITPKQIVTLAQQYGAQLVVSSYNEPLITTEWAVEIFQHAKAAGLRCAYVSNGNNTPQALAALRPYLDAYKIDLKTMQDKVYRQLGGVLQNVLDGIRRVYDSGLWVEVVTLVVPGLNDSPEELFAAARFIASVSPEIPWHVNAFHPDYQMTAAGRTPYTTLQQAAEIGEEAGLRYVYVGNLGGAESPLENTRCPQCQKTLIERRGFWVRSNHLRDGKCPHCQAVIAGVW